MVEINFLLNLLLLTFKYFHLMLKSKYFYFCLILFRLDNYMIHNFSLIHSNRRIITHHNSGVKNM